MQEEDEEGGEEGDVHFCCRGVAGLGWFGESGIWDGRGGERERAARCGSDFFYVPFWLTGGHCSVRAWEWSRRNLSCGVELIGQY